MYKRIMLSLRVLYFLAEYTENSLRNFNQILHVYLAIENAQIVTGPQFDIKLPRIIKLY